jgi:hypothetical protein
LEAIMNIDPCPVCHAEATWRGNVVDGWISCETSSCIIGGTFFNTDEGQAATAAQWNSLASAARLAKQNDPRYAVWLEEIRMWISEKVSFECDCEAYQESDTGAWIHNENTCAVFMEDHIDIVLKEVSGLLARAGEPQPGTAHTALPRLSQTARGGAGSIAGMRVGAKRTELSATPFRPFQSQKRASVAALSSTRRKQDARVAPATGVPFLKNPRKKRQPSCGKCAARLRGQ